MRKAELETLIGRLNETIKENEAILKQKEVSLKHEKLELEKRIKRYTLHLRNYNHTKKKTTKMVDFEEFRAITKLLHHAEAEWDDQLVKVNKLRADVAHYYGVVQQAMVDRIHAREELSEYGSGQVVYLKAVS